MNSHCAQEENYLNVLPNRERPSLVLFPLGCRLHGAGVLTSCAICTNKPEAGKKKKLLNTGITN